MIDKAVSSFPPPVRILLVDDYEPWRRSVCSMLKAHQQLSVIEEVGDGLTAVQRAKDFQPDLILLDIALPNLNGVEAARRLGRVAPSSRVLFLSQSNDADVVDVALSNGAKGYVLKMDAGKELLPAINAVLHGEKFISERLKSDSTVKQ